jgi:hypothetical protein
MSIQKSFVCDACEGNKPSDGYRPPDGWRTIEVEKSDSGFSGKKVELHACGARCAAKLLRKVADDLDPPKVEIPKSGHPYRS